MKNDISEKRKKRKNIFKKILDKNPGERFRYAYAVINRYINHNFFLKVILFSLGIGFICLGFILLFMPGPGVLFIIIGATLLCVASKKIALVLDTLEKKARR